MNVYRVDADLAYGTLVFAHSPKTQSGEEAQLRIWNKEFSDWDHHCETVGWLAPPIGYGTRNQARALPLDAVRLALGPEHNLLLSARARALLSPLLLPNGRFLPVRWEGHDYAIFECTALADVADPGGIEGERSEYRPGCWTRVDRWSFHPDRLATAPAIFTVPQDPFIRMCTDVFRDAVAAHDLLGFAFKPLWSEADGGVLIDNSPGQFMGEAGRQMAIAAKERRRAMLAILKARERQARIKPQQS
ncbi:hypothetical protein NFI95_09570 [Acetobacteraceae bacterium KSS8]|uniref:Uncharacterized protein n=1 Tax=Endosaccharibacter trunci TaxID=2812733 RepID=A0ABT1W8J0_9PROT|nr:hypothetical protein [Acetobacteraceae bacterium KSS8]